jgi:hypothetical protein
MAALKSRRLSGILVSALATRAIGDGEPEAYTREQNKILIQLGKRYGRGLLKARLATALKQDAEAFRRRIEIIQIFRSFSQNFRNHPCGQNTKDRVIDRLQEIGIRVSETTLSRDYQALGGARALRDTKPFAEGEDRSSPFEEFRRSKPRRLKN